MGGGETSQIEPCTHHNQMTRPFFCSEGTAKLGGSVAMNASGHWHKLNTCFCFRGFESILEDYTPQSLKKLAYPLLYCISIGTFAGLMYLNYTDVGICKAVQMIWSLK